MISQGDRSVVQAQGRRVTFSDAADTTSGFNGLIVVGNTGGDSLQNWTLVFDLAADITAITGAEIVGRSGNTYTVRAVSGAAAIGPGGSASISFTVAGRPDALPSAATLGGQALALAAPGTGTAALQVANDWGSGFTGSVTVTNTGTTAIEGWQVALDTAGSLSGWWNANVVSQSAGRIVLSNGSNNGHLAAGASTTFGFNMDRAANPSITVTLIGADGYASGGTASPTPPPASPPAPPPTVQVAGATVDEGAAGSHDAVFTITLSAASGQPVSVRYATADGTALAGRDYDANSGTVTFAAGETTKVVRIGTHAGAAGSTLQFTLALSAPTNATLGTGQASGTITNPAAPAPTPDGGAPGSVTLVLGNDWGSGFSGAVTLRNTSSTAIQGWKIEIDAQGTMTGWSNSTLVSRGSGRTVLGNDQNTGTIAPGASITVNFNMDRGGGTDRTVSAFLAEASGIAYGANTAPPPPPAPALPTLSVADAGIVAAGGSESFVVTLSAASTSAITVAYTTKDGTAHAASDYDAVSGTLRFAPGETSKTVAVSTHAGLANATPTLFLDLSAPSGATLARAEATGTIRNAAPSISAMGVTVHEAPVSSGGTTAPASGSHLLPSGYLHTAGSQILDANGTAVKLASVNWFGLDTSWNEPHGLQAGSYKTMMQLMVADGFNSLRLGVSEDLLKGGKPTWLDYSKNPDLQGLTGLQVLDKIVDYAGQIGLKIMLDHHRSSAGDGPNENGLWYGGGAYTDATFQSFWTTMATRYAGNSTVIGADLANEPHNATWGDGSATDWAAAATRAGNAILAINPNWLIAVEGIGSYNGQGGWWGGALQGVKDHPITLNVANQLIYSPHEYGASIYNQPWFNASDYPNNMPAIWDSEWGYIAKQNIAPIWIGEFGSKLETAVDRTWMKALVNYMTGVGAGAIPVAQGQQGLSWAYWAWNADAIDTGGIMNGDWATQDQNKLAAIQPAMYTAGSSGTPSGSTSDPGNAVFTVSLSAPSATAVTLHYATADGTAKAGQDYQAATGDITFAPGQVTQAVSVRLLSNAAANGTTSFLLGFSNPQNAALTTTSVTGSLVHDTSGGGTTPPATTPTPPPSTPTPSAGVVHADLALVNDWGSGFTGKVTVSNDTDMAIEGWKVGIDTAGSMSGWWDSTQLSHTGNGYVMANASWDGHIDAHGTVTFGFNMDRGADQSISLHMVT